MQLSDFLTLLTRIFYLLAAAISIINYIRYRDRIRLDVALLFGSLGIVMIYVLLVPLLPEPPIWGQPLTAILVISLGYLILRLVQHFRQVPRWIQIATVGGMILSWIPFVIYYDNSPDNPIIPQPVILAVIIYMVIVISYEAWAFLHGAARTSGVTRWRLILVAAATGILALTLTISGIVRIVPPLAEYSPTLSAVLGLFASISYYLGFAPPRWLRRSWQLEEVHTFLQESIATNPAEEKPARLLDRLAQFALRTVGGMRAVAALWADTQHQFIFSEQDKDLPELDRLMSEGLIASVWASGKPRFVQLRNGISQAEQQLADALDARSVFIIPIRKLDHPLGMLLVFMRYSSLFPDDDTEILRLLAEQSATDLEYARLLEDQRALVDKLNKRTTQMEEANRELEAFAYTVSHDLRAPLRAVDGFARILNEDHRNLLPQDGAENLDLILQNSKQMGQLIDDLLMFSRLGRTEVIRDRISMKDLTHEVLDDQLRSANGRSIKTHIGDLPDADANRGLMKQVFANLISNAVKFTRQQENAEIEIGSEQLNGNTVYYVRDNGVGFDMRYSNKLFGVFQRLQNPEDYEGTGVGLAIVQRIIHKHSGRVWAEAEPGSGATFFFELGEVESPQQDVKASTPHASIT
jgi:signal transduction histidine kinase